MSGQIRIRDRIETIFLGQAFERQLFYSYQGGLRFELSEGGHFINQFLTAHRKGLEICQRLFSDRSSIYLCIKMFGGKSLLSHLSALKLLKIAGVYSNIFKEYWTEFDFEYGDEYDDSLLVHYLAFEMPINALSSVLWCTFASDFGHIEPNPRADLYLFDLHREVIVFPYDDRGMDIVGNNRDLLLDLYLAFNHYLLDYDREAMDATFKSLF